MTVMTHVKALEAGQSSQETSEPITPATLDLYGSTALFVSPFSWLIIKYMHGLQTNLKTGEYYFGTPCYFLHCMICVISYTA